MGASQWPLSAAATRLLLALPAAGAKPRRLAPDSEPVKLALKELLVRGALTMTVEERRLGRNRVTLAAGAPPGSLPPPLARLDDALRPQMPGEIKEVLRAARALNPTLVKDIEGAARDELTARRLIEEHDVKRFGLVPARAWSRTASGDAWATTGAEHRERLSTLDRDLHANPDAAEAALAAGAVAVLVPSAMGPIALEHRRRQEAGAGYPAGGGAGGTGDDADGGGFDVFQGVGDMFDSALAGGMDSLDQGLDAIGGALDSVAGSIDGAIDSGVSAGGGDFGGGGDGGGGGGDGGGGG